MKQFTHRDGRTASAATPTEAVTLRAQGFEPVSGPGTVLVPDTGETLPYPLTEPSEDWKVAELDAYAADHLVDLTGLANKPEKLAAILAAREAALNGPSDRP